MKNLFLGLIIVFVVSIGNNYAQNITMAAGSSTYACTGGTYSDPGGAGNYGNNVNTTQTICAPAGQYLTFNFTSFATEGCCDFLNIYNGANTAAPLLGTFSGTNNPGTFVVNPGQCITFNFTTDGSVVNSGWTATMSCSATPPPVPSNITMTSGTTTTYNCNGGVFLDPGGAGNYANSINFTHTICAPAGQYLTFNFTQFQTESNLDVLTIYNGSTTGAPLLGTYSGTNSPGTITVNPGQCITFRFVTDGSVTYSGWSAAMSCSTTPPPPPPPVPGTCATSQPFCTSSGVTFPGSTNTTAQTGPNYGCLFTQPNPAWYYLNIATAGNINITMTNSAGVDIDFALWGPFASQAAMCAGITAAPISCSYSTAATETAVITGAAVGQWYMLVVTNFANVPTNITATQTSGTGATNCNILCDMYGLTATPGACVPATSTYSVSGNISFTNPPTSGTLTVSSSCGQSMTIAQPWISPIAYNLPGINANGGACSITAAFSADATCQLTQPYTAPAACTPCTVTAGNNGPSCAGTTFNLTASAVAGATGYSWTGPSGYTSTAQNPTGIGAALPAGSYNYTVTVTTPSGTCTSTTTVVVTAAPTVSVTPTATICQGGSVNLTASGMTTYSWSPTTGLTPTTGATVSASPASTQVYTVTGSTPGCNNSTATSTVTVTVPPTPNFTVGGNFCQGATSVNFTNTSTGTTGGTTYAWTFPSGTPATSTAASPSGVTWTTPGTYNITLTATTAGCPNSITIPITIQPAPTVTITRTHPPCNGGNGTINATGSTAGSFSWSSGQNTAGVHNVPAGSYTVTFTSAAGCVATATTTVTNPPVLAITATGTNPTCNGTCNGTLTANTATGGTAPYTYSWNGGLGAGQNKTGVCAGTYIVTVTDANNCTATATVTITAPPVITVATTQTNVLCNGACNGTINVTPGGGTGAYTYAWTGGLTGQNPTGVCAGTYTVTVSSPAGCSQNATVTITAPPALTVTASGTNIACNGVCNGTLSASASGGTGAITYSWNGGVGAGANHSGRCAGAYTVTATDANGCTATATYTITQPSALTVAMVNSPATCNGVCSGTATATPSGGTSPYTYQWNAAGNLGTANSASSLCVGAPSVVVTDANGCTVTGNTTITQPSAIVVNTSFTASTCGASNGQACATISGGTGPYTQIWSPSAQTGLCANNIAAGAYTITVTDGNGCTQTGTVNVVDAGGPTASITASTNVSCNGGNNGSATVTASGGVGPYTYLWNAGTTPTNATTSGLPAGTASVVVTAANGCQANASVVITQPTILTAAITASTNVSCNGGNNGSATVTANGGTSPYTYTWNNSPSTTVTASGLTAGTAQTVTVTDALGCQVTASITLTQPTAVGGTINATNPLCNGACDGSADLTPTGGTIPYSYSWNDPATTTSQDVSGLCAGAYNVIITDANGCQFTVSTTLTNPALLNLTASATDAHCNQSDGQACVNALGGTGSYTYIWNNPSSSTTACTNGVAPGNYSVTVTDANGCTASTAQTVSNIAGPTATATVVSDATGAGVCNGVATVSVANGSAPYTYSWDSTPVQTTQNATGLCAGTYCVTVTDAFGCTSVSCITINEPNSITVTITPTDLLCNGVCNGQTTTTVSGGVAPYTFLWAHGPTAANLTGLCAGTYNLTVTDANGNTGTQSVTITQPTAIVVASLTSTPALCNAACSGTITANANGGTGTLVYSWTGGLAAGTNPTNVCAGPYTLTVTDANNCTVTGNVNVAQPTPLVLNTSSTNSNCGQADGQTCVTISGGTAPYTQLWDDPSTQTTLCASSILAGNYNVVVTDNNGCTANASVTVNNNSAGTANAVINNNVFCNGGCSGSATASMTGGQAPFSYLWSSGATPTAATTAGLCVGNASVTITDANGCSSVASVTISQPSALSIVNSSTPVSCNGGSNGTVSTVASGGTSAVVYTYSWINQTTSAVVGTTPTVNGLPAGTYCVTVTDDNMCTINSCVTVTQPAIISMTPASTNSNCAQANGTLSVSGIAGGSGTYVSTVWTDASNVVVTDPNAVLAGSYTVTVTDNNGCIGTANINVNDLTGPTASFVSAINPTCNGLCDGQGVANVTGGVAPYTLVWSPAPATGQGTLNIGGLCADDYTLLATDAAGCASTITISITQPAVVGLAPGTVSAVSGAGVCDGTASVVASGGTTPYSYAWFTTCANTTTTGVTAASSTGLCAGSYSVVVTDANGCTDDVCITITSPNAITSTVNMVPTLCNGSSNGSLTVSPSGGVPGYTYQWFVSPANTPIGGQTAATASNLAAGNYYVVVTDANGITHSSAVTTVTSPTAVGGIATVTSNYNGYGVSCETTCNGTAIANPLGGTAPYSYDWGTNAGNQTTQSATNLCFGIYDVTVADANGCIGVLQVTISKPPTFTSSITSINDPCNATCAGSATVSTIGGIAPVTYQWDNPALSTTATASGLCAGTYNAVITDANGCVLNETATISEPAAIVLSGTSQGSNCNQNDGNATVSIVSGAGPFTYLWNAAAGNQTTPTANNLFAGCYDVVVTNSIGCNATIQVCVNDLGAPTANILTQTDVTCNGLCDGFAQIQIIGGTAPYNYTWVDSNGNPTGVTTASNNTLCAGTYTGQMVDANGCQASVGVTINQPLVLNGLISASSDVSCFGECDGSATATIVGGTVPYIYQWNDPASQTTATANNLCPGTYTLNVLDAHNCAFSVSATIAEPAQILLNTTTVSAFCNTGTGSATAVLVSGGIAPMNYSWNDPSTQNAITALNLVPGNYIVTATDANGCNNTANVTVGNIPEGIATLSNINDVLCFGGSTGSVSVSMSGTGTAPYTYNWFNGSGLAIGQTTITANNLPTGNYYVEVTDANGCISTSNTTLINQPALLQATASMYEALCNGSCDGIAESVTTGGVIPYTYSWDDPLNQNNIAAGNLCAGTYTVTVTDNNGCTTTASTTVTEPSVLTATETVVNANCGLSNGSGCVIPSGGEVPYTYLWPNNSTNSCETGLPAGSYCVEITDKNNCQYTHCLNIQDLNGPSASIINTVNVSCNGGANGSATVDMIGGNGFFTAQWDNSTGNQVTPTASNLAAGSYGVTITDSIGCTAATSVTILEPDALVSFQLFNNPSCFQACDGTAQINVVGGTLPYSYSWTNNLNAVIGSNATVTNLCQGNYNLTLNDANGCNQILNYVITDPVQVTGTVAHTNVTCFGACNGTITATGVNGVAPFTYQWDAAAANQTTATASGLCPGTYTCTITDANGCINTVTGTITQPTMLIADIPTSQNVTCFGLNNGFATALGSGGTLPYSYSWNNGAGTNATAINLISGSYEVTVTDANGCTAQSDVFIAQPTQLSATSSKTNVTCFGACNGTASVAVSGGTPNYTYQWDNAGFSTTSGIANLCNGIYTVIITDANNCQISTSVNITQPTDINISATITNSNCGQNNGQICVNTFGGTFPYVYQWNDPFTQTTACASSLNAGCYLLTITDGNACFKDTLLCINDIAGPTVTFINSVNVNCNGNQNGLVEFNAAGGTGALSLQWFNNLGVLIPAGNGTSLLNNLNGGCYTFQATDAAGCIASLTNCITEPNAINSAIFPSTNVTCFNGCNGTATVNANGGTAPYSFNWNNPGNTTTAGATGLCAGTFTATVTDANSCSTQSSITITQPQQLQLSIVNTVRPLCFGDCNGGATIGITGGTQPYLISWLTNGASGLTNGGLCAGQHTVIVTDANGCTAQIEVPIQDQAPLTALGNIVGATCSSCNGSLSLVPNGGVPNYSYNWNGVGNTVGQIANQGLCPGNGSVTVTDLNGCVFNVLYTIPDAGSPVIDNMTFTSPSCFGTSNGSASVFVSQGTPNYTYTWNDPFSQTVANAVALPAGNYCVSVSDQNGCATSNCINVTQPSVLGAVPDISRTICYGESTQLWASGQGGTSPYTINWSTAGLSGGGPIAVSPTSTTNYCFTVTDVNGCLSPNACVTITVREPLAIDLIDVISLCTGLDVDLMATASGGDATGYSFSWINIANNQVIPDVEVGATSTITVGPTIPTTYQVTLSDGCSTNAIDEVTVNILNNPVAFLNVADSNGCEPFNAQFTINTDIGTNFFFDVNCDGTNEVTTTNTNLSYLFANDGLYDICLNVVSAAGCTTSLNYPQLIEVYPLPVANFIPDPASTTILTPYITFNDNSTGGVSYTWNFGDGLSVNGPINSTITNVPHTTGPMVTPLHTYADTGVFNVTLTITTEYGCISNYTYPVVIGGDYAFYVANAFTPDGDGVNDTFKPDGIGIDRDNYSFLIFNRWGELIFETYNPDTAWDGYYKGTLSQQDVYVWKIKTKDHTKKEREYYGHVTLVR